MDFFDALHASSAGLAAQRLRMNLISGNLANAHTTRTEDGGPYRRREPVFAAQAQNRSFGEVLSTLQTDNLPQVKVVDVVEDQSAPILKYDPMKRAMWPCPILT
jgi:flagellar basal-body rod protein FlgC